MTIGCKSGFSFNKIAANKINGIHWKYVNPKCCQERTKCCGEKVKMISELKVGIVDIKKVGVIGLLKEKIMIQKIIILKRNNDY